MEARFSAVLLIGPLWRLRVRACLILASAPEDKQTLMPCHWRGAELVEAFRKARSPSPSNTHTVHLLPLALLGHRVRGSNVPAPFQRGFLGQGCLPRHEDPRAIWVTIPTSVFSAIEDFAAFWPRLTSDPCPPPRVSRRRRITAATNYFPPRILRDQDAKMDSGTSKGKKCTTIRVVNGFLLPLD